MVQTCSCLLLTAAGLLAAVMAQDGQELVGTWLVVEFKIEGKASLRTSSKRPKQRSPRIASPCGCRK